jgi:hypothetical protein
MLGLWSRPIRGGTLKYLGLSLLDAPSLLTAMYRFTRFWNLLLDDYALRLSRRANVVTLALEPLIAEAVATIFGHELMIKLSHGVASWLVGRELPIVSVGFGFSRPAHFVEYAQLFPGPVTFDQEYTSISFEERFLRQRFHRTRAELLQFVRRAPDDWIFVTFDHDSTASRIRGYIRAARRKRRRQIHPVRGVRIRSDDEFTRLYAIVGHLSVGRHVPFQRTEHKSGKPTCRKPV